MQLVAVADQAYRWDDLADSELRARLVQRRVRPDLLERLVRHREDPDEAAAIDAILNP